MQSKRDECELRGYTTQYLMSSTHIVIYNRQYFQKRKKNENETRKNKEEVNEKRKKKFNCARSYSRKNEKAYPSCLCVYVWVQFIIDS